MDPDGAGRVEMAAGDQTGGAVAPSTVDDPQTARVALNKLCELEDWRVPARVAAMRRALPYFLDISPDYPAGMEHRKHWEFAQLLVGLEQLGALNPDGLVLSVGAGHEEPVYELTNRVRWVFATDIYGQGRFRRLEEKWTDRLSMAD